MARLTCDVLVEDACNKVVAAIYVALKRAFVVSIDQARNFNEKYACLYGPFTDNAAGYAGAAPREVIPAFPDAVVFMGVLQSALSATFLFLFFLALKNQFRAR